MTRTRLWIGVLMLLAGLITESAAAPRHFVGSVPSGGDPGSEMLRALVEHFAPEQATLVLDALPDAENSVRHLFLEVTGATTQEFRVARMRLEPAFVTFSPISSWHTSGGLKVEKIVSAKFEAEISEEDLNNFLRNKAFSKDDGKWIDAAVDLRGGAIEARARYVSGMVRALVELHTELQVREGNQIWFTEYAFSVNGDPQSEGLIREALQKIQPVVDFRNFVFPVKIAFLDVDDEVIRVRTRTSPAPFQGLTYTYAAR